MNFEETIEELEKIITDLREENETIPVIVEGEKDTEALRTLGLKGEIIQLNKGMSLLNFCDRIATQYKAVILLTDWDRKGGHLCFVIRKNLESRVVCNTKYRELLSKKSKIRTVEALPSWIITLQQKIRAR